MEDPRTESRLKGLGSLKFSVPLPDYLWEYKMNFKTYTLNSAHGSLFYLFLC